VDSNLKFRGRAIYLHLVDLPATSSPEESARTYVYIGQAYNTQYRIFNQHVDFRYRRDHPSLHNYAMDRSISDKFVILATLNEACDDAPLVINLLEMWCCVMFGTLPGAMLKEWALLGLAPAEGNRRLAVTNNGLNIALPLDTGDEMASKAAFPALRNSKDSLARNYYWDAVRGNLRPKALPAPTASTAPAPSPARPARPAYVLVEQKASQLPGFLFGSLITFIVTILIFGPKRAGAVAARHVAKQTKRSVGLFASIFGR
jgi:hypothetical protein